MSNWLIIIGLAGLWRQATVSTVEGYGGDEPCHAGLKMIYAQRFQKVAHLPNWHITVDSTKMRDDNGHGEYRLRYAASVMLAVISCPSGGPQKALSMLSTINENARERSQMMGCEAISRANEKAT